MTACVCGPGAAPGGRTGREATDFPRVATEAYIRAEVESFVTDWTLCDWPPCDPGPSSRDDAS